jgi:hypothetical protein
VEAFGLPAGSTRSYEEMFDGFNLGWIDFGVPVPGTRRRGQAGSVFRNQPGHCAQVILFPAPIASLPDKEHRHYPENKKNVAGME